MDDLYDLTWIPVIVGAYKVSCKEQYLKTITRWNKEWNAIKPSVFVFQTKVKTMAFSFQYKAATNNPFERVLRYHFKEGTAAPATSSNTKN